MSGTAKRRKKKVALPRHYSGERSETFWARVKRLPLEYNHEAYALGVVLQNVEHQAIAAIEAGERAREDKSFRDNLSDLYISELVLVASPPGAEPLKGLVEKWRGNAELSSIRVKAHVYRECADDLAVELSRLPAKDEL